MDEDQRIVTTIRFIRLRPFIYLRLMNWKHFQGLFQIHAINTLVDRLTNNL